MFEQGMFEQARGPDSRLGAGHPLVAGVASTPAPATRDCCSSVCCPSKGEAVNHRYRSEPYPTEPIEVVMGTDGAPVRFRWRGRRYVVRAVMTTWVESVPWWPQSRGQEGARWPQSRGQEGARWPQSRGQRASGQRIAWRVEAAAATGAVGVYELCRIRCGPGDGVGEGPDEVDLWGLLRVID